MSAPLTALAAAATAVYDAYKKVSSAIVQRLKKQAVDEADAHAAAAKKLAELAKKNSQQ